MRRLPDWFLATAPGLALFLLNLAIVWPLLSLEYPADFSSIEGAFIGIATHLRHHFSLTGWFPYWYGGIPFPSTYPPLSHVLTALWSWAAGHSVALSYHQVSAVTYCLIPPALSCLALSLRAPRLPAWMAGLFATLASPSAWLIHPIGSEMGGWRHARRFQVLVAFGEYPNLASILFCLIALALLALAFRSRNPLWSILASLACAATALSNWLGAFVLALGALALLLSQEDVFAKARWIQALLIAMFAYGVAAPWLPPSTIAAVRRNAPFVGGRYESSALVYVYVAAGLLLALALLWALRAMGTGRALRFSAFWSLFLGGTVLLAAKQGIELLPQSMRYHIAMELALAMLIVIGGCWFLREALNRPLLSHAFLAALLVLGAVQMPVTWSYARSLIHSGDPSQSIEAQTVRWVESKLPGQRVYLPGSISFWADAFGTVTQFGGGFDNGIENPTYLHVKYQIESGEGAGAREGEIGVTWLKAYGVRAAQVPLPDGPANLRMFRNPAKFDGVLEPVWDHMGARIYRVPARQEGLAFVVPEAAVPRTRPTDGLDVGEARRYVEALEDATLPVTQFEWRGPGDATIEAAPGADQAVSVQVSYHPGWEATSGGRALSVEEDGLGQIVLRPGPGRHRIHLVFTGGTEGVLTRTASCLSLLVILIVAIPPSRNRALALLAPHAPGLGRWFGHARS
ncbi:MAG: hypothetical protein IT169_17725 [Bryobacterales bacterium]|nr:hypothetical protein [Bryobacterales bacterium]